MNKRTFILFILLLIFWLAISMKVDIQYILIGGSLSLLTVWFWQDLGLRLPGTVYTEELIRLVHCLVLLIGYIIQSNIVVIKTLLFSERPLDPVFVEMDTPIESSWGRVFLATCITITPGTVTIDINPETGRFVVHALTEEIGMGLLYWRLIHRIEDLEKCRQRRDKHVMDADRAYGSNPSSTTESGFRSDSH